MVRVVGDAVMPSAIGRRAVAVVVVTVCAVARAACCLPSSWVLSAIVVVGRAMHEGLRCQSIT